MLFGACSPGAATATEVAKLAAKMYCPTSLDVIGNDESDDCFCGAGIVGNGKGKSVS